MPRPQAEFGHIVKPQGMGAGMYRLRNTAGRLLYVGIGACPATRIKQHSRTKEWWPEVDQSTIEVTWFLDIGKAEVAETTAIQTEDPLYNKRHSPRWQHYSTVRSARLAAERIAKDEIPMNLAGSNINDLVRAAGGARRCVFVLKNGSRAAAVVPASLGEVVHQLGGVDAAEEALRALLAMKRHV